VPFTDAAVFINVPPMAVVWPFLLAAGSYLLLRWVIWGPGGGSAATASQHAFWVGIMGWLASSLQPAGNAGILYASPDSQPLISTAAIVPALAWPILGSLAVHAIGQLSYPGPRLPRRQADLGLRRVRDFLPRPLAWTVLAVFAGAALQIGWMATLPGYDPVPYGSRPDPAAGFVPYGGDGRVPGIELASYLGPALLVLGAGTWLVLVLITRRRRLEALDSVENSLLRTIAMNRLLRTAATIASGLAAIAGNHAARPDPSLVTSGWMNAAGAVNLAVLLAMWWWAPPKLPAAQEDGTMPERRGPSAASHPATRLSVSLGAASGLAAFVPAMAAVFIPGALAGHPALVVALAAASVLLVTAAGELLIQRNYGTSEAPRGWPRQPVSPAMLTTGIAALTILAAAVIVTSSVQADLGILPSWSPTLWACAAVALVAVLPAGAAKARKGIPTAVAGLDAALRAITMHRVVRTLAACFTAQAGVLLLAAGPGIRRTLELEPAPWAWAWDAAPFTGALLCAAGIVIAVIPVRSFARSTASARTPAKEPAT
jgi:hypothetical protein